MGTLRRFTLVGVVVTFVDVAGFLLLTLRFDLSPWLGELIAVSVATLLSWSLHAAVTFPDDPSQHWYRSLGRYVATAIGALVLSVTTVVLLDGIVNADTWYQLAGIKAAALFIAFTFRVNRYRDTMFVAIRSEQNRRAGRPAPPGSFRASVVLPAFNEADRIEATITTVAGVLQDIDSNGGLEIVVVDDGSGDGTAELAESAGAHQVIVHPTNRGKGAAVRSGMLAAQGRTVVFTDSDLAYSPDQITGLIEAIESGWDVVVGSRQHVDTRTVVRAGRLRELGGRGINLLSAYVLLGRYRDTQCGLKAFRADVAKVIFSRARIDGFGFDIEVFALVERYRLALVEVPVTLANSERSTVRVVRDALRLIVDLFRIRSFARAGAYEPDRLSELPPPVTN